MTRAGQMCDVNDGKRQVRCTAVWQFPSSMYHLLWDECDVILPCRRTESRTRCSEVCDYLSQGAVLPDDKDARRMMARLEVIGKVLGQGLLIPANEDATLTLCPDEDIWICSSERQVWGVADPHGIDQALAGGIVLLDRLPQRPSEVFIK